MSKWYCIAMDEGQRDLTQGQIVRPMVSFAIPLIAGNMLQTLYNVADSIIVGHFTGPDALAAVGSSYSLMTFLTSLMIGLSMGVSVAFSRYFGKKEYENLKASIGISFVLIGTISAIITIASWLLLPSIIRLISVPEELVDMMESYMYIILAGLPALFVYNFYSAAERSIGNSAAALMMMALSAVINVVLDLYFVISLDWGVEGAALATIISQYAAAAAIALYTLFRSPALHFRMRDAARGVKMLPKLLSLSILTSMQQSIMNLGILMVQGVVNSFGASVMAGYAAAIKLNNMVITSITTVGNGISSFSAQNFGAGKLDRVRRGWKEGIILSLAFSVTASLLFVFLGRYILLLFMNNDAADALEEGMRFLRIVSPFYALITFKLITDGVLRGAGDMKPFMISTFSDLILRVTLAFIFSAVFGAVGIWLSWPVGWAVGTALSLFFYKSGHWAGRSLIK